MCRGIGDTRTHQDALPRPLKRCLTASVYPVQTQLTNARSHFRCQYNTKSFVSAQGGKIGNGLVVCRLRGRPTNPGRSGGADGCRPIRRSAASYRLSPVDKKPYSVSPASAGSVAADIATPTAANRCAPLVQPPPSPPAPEEPVDRHTGNDSDNHKWTGVRSGRGGLGLAAVRRADARRDELDQGCQRGTAGGRQPCRTLSGTKTKGKGRNCKQRCGGYSLQTACATD